MRQFMLSQTNMCFKDVSAYPSGCCVIIASSVLLEYLIESLRQYEICQCSIMWLQKYTSLLVLCQILQSVVYGDDKNYTCFLSSKGIDVTYRCENLFNLEIVDRIPGNVRSIIFQDSNLMNIHGNAFTRFGATLTSLDIHESKVVTIDYQAFTGLHNLQNLSLYGNNLSYVYAIWFTHLSNLRTLDISFNSIVGIELQVFPLLPNLEYFYFDGNRLSAIDWTAFNYMPKLKKVKTGRNPWMWTYRALLMQLFDDRGIDYDDDWENWRWINTVIWECSQTIQMGNLNDQVLDCVVMKLLTFVNENLKFQSLTSQNDKRCHTAASRLIGCSRNNSLIKTDDEAVRMSLQGLFYVIKPMEHPGDEFKLK